MKGDMNKERDRHRIHTGFDWGRSNSEKSPSRRRRQCERGEIVEINTPLGMRARINWTRGSHLEKWGRNASTKFKLSDGRTDYGLGEMGIIVDSFVRSSKIERGGGETPARAKRKNQSVWTHEGVSDKTALEKAWGFRSQGPRARRWWPACWVR